jgi:hypothetical protein
MLLSFSAKKVTKKLSDSDLIYTLKKQTHINKLSAAPASLKVSGST